MLWQIGIALAVIIALFVILVATRPGTFRIQRSTTIAASPDALFDLVNDFHKWQAWSPWENIDPTLQRNYSGPTAGVGASYHWIGNKKVGEGRMTIQQSDPARRIAIKLEFLKPFAATNAATFTFAPTPAGTTVTWIMEGGKSNFMCKCFSLLMSMDKMVGPYFEKGLANMKNLAEHQPVPTA